MRLFTQDCFDLTLFTACVFKKGRVTFEKLTSGLIRVRAKICNLTANAVLGFHVHEFGDLTGLLFTQFFEL